jgi:hypothetical protein
MVEFLKERGYSYSSRFWRHRRWDLTNAYDSYGFEAIKYGVIVLKMKLKSIPRALQDSIVQNNDYQALEFLLNNASEPLDLKSLRRKISRSRNPEMYELLRPKSRASARL